MKRNIIDRRIIGVLCLLVAVEFGAFAGKMKAADFAKRGNFVVTDFGAKGDGIVDDAAAIQQTIDACNASGGGTVLFPAGKTFLAGPLHMRSNVNLHLEPNSMLLANPDESIYHESAFGENEGEGMMWLSGKDIRNFSISGTGRIDGNAVAIRR